MKLSSELTQIAAKSCQSLNPTSNRYLRVGMSTAHISATLTNWELVWSLRNVITGTTPSGCIMISSSSPLVIWTFCTYFGIHWPTYWPKSTRFCFVIRSVGRTVAAREAIVCKETDRKKSFYNKSPNGHHTACSSSTNDDKCPFIPTRAARPFQGLILRINLIIHGYLNQ